MCVMSKAWDLNRLCRVLPCSIVANIKAILISSSILPDVPICGLSSLGDYIDKSSNFRSHDIIPPSQWE